MMSINQKTDVNVIAIENCSWSNSALDDEGRVWTWAESNNSFRMGRTTSGTDTDANYYGRGGQVTTTIEAGVNLPFILQISGSVENTLALDRDGNVWSWGTNSENALGRSGDRGFPGKINLPDGIKAKWIAAGYHGGRIIDEEGNIWVWGNGSEYGLGTGSTSSVATPTKLTIDSTNAADSLVGVKFTMISSSDYDNLSASMALTEDGDIYTWGNNNEADIGGSQRPRNVGNYSSLNIKKIDVSNGIFGFLTEDGDVYTWGDNNWWSAGRQGHNDTLARSAPAIIETVKKEKGGGIVDAPKFKDLSLYAWSMCAVDVDGIIYGCGTNESNNKHTGLGTESILTGYAPNGLPPGSQIFIVSEGYQQTSYVDVYGNAYATGPSASRGNNSDDGSIAGPWVHFTGSGKPMFTLLSSNPDLEVKRYSTTPKTSLEIETNISSDEIKYVILYSDDTDQYADGETFYSKSFAQFEQPYYNKGTNPQLLLSPNYDLWSSRYYANPKISEDVFEAAYEVKTAAEKGTMDASDGNNTRFTKADAVSYDCIVWLQSRNSFGTTRMIFRFDNYYTPAEVWQEGVKLNDATYNLYLPELVSGNYGLLLDRDGNLMPGEPPLGYDIVKPEPKPLNYWLLSPGDQTDEALAGDGYVHRVNPDKEVFLTLLSQIGDELGKTPRVTFTYDKNPAMWVDATLHFVDDAGNPVSVMLNGNPVTTAVQTAFAPKDALYTDGQEPYIPPEAVDPVNKVTGYSIGTAPDGSAGSFTKCNFPDGFTPTLSADTDVYIVYIGGTVSVTETFIDISGNSETAIKNNDGLPSVVRNLDQGIDNYDQTPPAISGYCLVGHEITVGAAAPVRTDYPWVNDQYEPQNAYVASIPSDTTVRFFYKVDANGDGIPHEEAGMVEIHWKAVYADNTVLQITKQTLYGNGAQGATITINEDKSTVLPAALYDPAGWLFRPGQVTDTAPYLPIGSSSSATISFTAGDTQTVYFYYDEDHNENGIADRLEGIFTEQYKLSPAGDDLTPPKADTSSKWLGGQTYRKAALHITNYVSIGYVIEADGSTVEEVDQVTRDDTGNVAVSYAIPAAGTGTNYTVTFLYKQDSNNNGIPDDLEGSVTVTWVGTTYAGNPIELNKLVIEGYIGDDVTSQIYPPSPIDDVWKLANSDIPAAVILTATPQAYQYQYTEILVFSTITVESSSTDGKLDFSYQFAKKLTDDVFDITAFTIPTYRITGYSIFDSYDNAISTGTEDTVSVDPAEGSQRVVFHYESVITTVEIRAVDTNDFSNALQSQTVTDAVIGQKYSSAAPYIDDTWVLIGDALKVIDVKAGTNEIVFQYEKAMGNVTVLLKEDDTAGSIIRVLSETITNGSTASIPIPDLTAAYYTAISTAEVTVDFTAADPIPDTIEYYYKKDMMDATIRAVDSQDDSELKTNTYAGSARKGESYTAIAPTVEWYTLTEPNSKSVYVDPGAADNTIIVDFTYESDDVSNITVKFFYEDTTGTAISLQEYTAQNAVGEKFTAAADSFPGFSLISDPMIEIVINADSNKNIISFEYSDDRVIVGVFTQIGADGTTRQKIAADPYVSGSAVTVIPPYMENHLVTEYIIDAEDPVTVDPTSFTDLELSGSDAVTADMSIVFVYTLIDDIINDDFISVAIQGVTNEITHYSYLKRIAKSTLPLTLKMPSDVFEVPGYILDAAADFSVTAGTVEKIFNYVSLATTVTIRMVDGTDTDVADSFAVSAVTASPFTYNAPNVPNYYLTGSSLGKVNAVLANGASVILFTYAEIVSAVTIVAKEDDTNGRVIGVFQAEDPQEGTVDYDVPDLSADYYTANTPKVEITYDGENSVSAEAYYTKDKAAVPIAAEDYLSDQDLGSQNPLTDQRKGEAVTVNAPNVTNYELVGADTQIVIADGINQAVFQYKTLANDEISVKAVDSNGNLLQSYLLSGTIGEIVSAEPPILLGWITSDEAQTGQIGTDREIVFHYTRNAVTITINTVDTQGTSLGSSTAQAARGGDYTAYAPHIPGYVIEGSTFQTLEDVATDASLTFTYQTIASVASEYSTIITVIGRCEDQQLYLYSVVRPKNSGNYDLYPRDVDQYTPACEVPTSVNVEEEDQIALLDYDSNTTTVAIYMIDEETDIVLAVFIESANKGESFTYVAPKIIGYGLTSPSASGSVEQVLPNGASNIRFTYKKSEE